MCFLSASLAIGTSVATSVGLSVTATGAGAAAISTTTAAAVGTTVLSLGVLAVAGTAISGVVSTVAAVQQAEQQAELAEAQAEIEQQNALMAARRAERIDMEANQKRAALLRESQQTVGTGRAGYAASGVVLGSGVTLDYEADVADVLDLDMRNLNYDVKSQQWQQHVSASNNRSQAAMYRFQQKNAENSKSGTILGGILKTTASTVGTAFAVGGALKSLMPAASAATAAAPASDLTMNVPIPKVGNVPTLLA